MFLGNLKYREKVLMPFALVLILISAGLFFIYRTSLGTLVEGQRETLSINSRLAQYRIEQRTEDLKRTVRLFQTNRPMIEYLYITTVLGGDTAPLLDMLRPIFISLKVDSLTLFDTEGRRILELDTMAPNDGKGHADNGIKNLLLNEITEGFIEDYGKAKIASAGPLLYQDSAVGYIAAGKYIDGEFLEELRNISGEEFFFVRGNEIAASTIYGVKMPAYRPVGGMLTVGQHDFLVNEQEIRATDGETLGRMVTALSNEPLKKSLHRLKLYIYWTLAVSFVLSAVLSAVLIKALVSPLNDMVASIGRVAEGRFDEEMKTGGKDEIAALSVHFNEMQRQLTAHRKALENYAEDLERAVEERSRELEKVQGQLIKSQKMESLGTMASGIAHDFNNILSAILGYASFVKEQIKTDDPHYKYWDIVEQAATRGAELTSKLLTFSGEKVDMTKKSPVEINVLVREISRLLSRTFPKSISFELRLSEEDLYVTGNGSSLYQALMNICINARDSMPSGGKIILETAFSEPPPEAPAVRHVRISITDTGSGMDKKVLDRVFEPFFTTKEAGRGTGLGLAVVYGIVQEHGGVINVYSEPGKGTAFRIYLPTSEEIAAPEAEAAKAPAPEGMGKTILVVDDEEHIRQFCKETFEAAGFRAIAASDGVEALNIYRRHAGEISAVILDAVMPEMSGHEVLRRLRELDPGVKVVLSSGFSPEIGIKWADEEGVKGFIQKPYRAQDILTKLSEVLKTA